MKNFILLLESDVGKVLMLASFLLNSDIPIPTFTLKYLQVVLVFGLLILYGFWFEKK